MLVGLGVGGLDRGPHPTVQARPPCRGELVVQRVAHQLVGEAVPPDGVGDFLDDTRLHGLVERVEQVGVVRFGVGDRLEQLEVELESDDGPRPASALLASADRRDRRRPTTS